MDMKTDFAPLALAAKLRRAAAELRAERDCDLVSERFARRLEAHADAMLRPEAPPCQHFSGLRENPRLRLGGR